MDLSKRDIALEGAKVPLWRKSAASFTRRSRAGLAPFYLEDHEREPVGLEGYKDRHQDRKAD
jgi:hypothetical protein